jgi:glycine/D-amino acid oxidase-like deaminating enzyme
MAANFPTQARVVVIGGGIMGCSTAYHLAKLGWKDVVLLEQGRLSGGTTWHAAGLVGQLRSYQNLTRLIRYSTELYSKLEAETGLATGWKQCGSLSARTEGAHGAAAPLRRHGQRPGRVDCEPLTPQQAGEKSHHAHRRPVGARCGCRATARPIPPTSPRRWPAARAPVACALEKTRVTAVDTRTDGVTGVQTTKAPSRPRSSSIAPANGRASSFAWVTVPLSFLRAHVDRHREDGERAARPAGDARSRRLHLLQGGVAPDGRLRARRAALEQGDIIPDDLSSACCPDD